MTKRCRDFTLSVNDSDENRPGLSNQQFHYKAIEQRGFCRSVQIFQFVNMPKIVMSPFPFTLRLEGGGFSEGDPPIDYHWLECSSVSDPSVFLSAAGTLPGLCFFSSFRIVSEKLVEGSNSVLVYTVTDDPRATTCVNTLFGRGSDCVWNKPAETGGSTNSFYNCVYSYNAALSGTKDSEVCSNSCDISDSYTRVPDCVQNRWGVGNAWRCFTHGPLVCHCPLWGVIGCALRRARDECTFFLKPRVLPSQFSEISSVGKVGVDQQICDSFIWNLLAEHNQMTMASCIPQREISSAMDRYNIVFCSDASPLLIEGLVARDAAVITLVVQIVKCGDTHLLKEITNASQFSCCANNYSSEEKTHCVGGPLACLFAINFFQNYNKGTSTPSFTSLQYTLLLISAEEIPLPPWRRIVGPVPLNSIEKFHDVLHTLSNPCHQNDNTMKAETMQCEENESEDISGPTVCSLQENERTTPVGGLVHNSELTAFFSKKYT